MPACAMISCALGVGVDEPEQAVRDRRQPAAAVDEDRHPPLGGEREHRREALVVEEELLRARVELDPAGAEVEAALRLLDRLLVEGEPDEGDHAAARALRERERTVVAGPEAGMPVGLVQAEHEAARDAVPVHALFELLVAAGHAVDVVAEVRVRVEDLGAGGKLGVAAPPRTRRRAPGPARTAHSPPGIYRRALFERRREHPLDEDGLPDGAVPLRARR